MNGSHLRLEGQRRIGFLDRREICRAGLMRDEQLCLEIRQLFERLHHGEIDPARAGAAAKNQQSKISRASRPQADFCQRTGLPVSITRARGK